MCIADDTLRVFCIFSAKGLSHKHFPPRRDPTSNESIVSYYPEKSTYLCFSTFYGIKSGNKNIIINQQKLKTTL
jgi:hypothetical protein